jgi:hypothetical protein
MGVSFVSDFADQAVLLTLILMVAVALAAAGWRRGAVGWIFAVAATLTVILAGKVAVYVCACTGALPPDTGLKSPSGHTAAAAVVYGGLFALLAPRWWGPRLSALAAAGLVAFVIGVTRIALNAHTPIDVLVGAVIGIAGAVLLAQIAGERPAGMRRLGPSGVTIAVVILFHGERLEAEAKIQSFSHLLWAPAGSLDKGQVGEVIAALPLQRTEMAR